MDRDELLFRDGCRKWHTYLERCADGGQLDKASLLLRKIAQYVAAWGDNLATARAATREAEKQVVECRGKEASIQRRLRMLRQLSAAIEHRLVKRAKSEHSKTERERILTEEKAKKEKAERERTEKERAKKEKAEEDRSGGDNE